MDIEQIEKLAKEVLIDTGEHTPQIIAIDKDGKSTMISIPFSNDVEKEKIMFSMRLLINSLNIEKYFFISDTWISQNPNVRPMNSPERSEALCIFEFNKKDKDNYIFQKYHRDGDKIIFDERLEKKDCVESYSSWNFYKEDVMEEKMAQIKKTYNDKNGKRN